MACGMLRVEEPQAVVFVSDRSGAALRRARALPEARRHPARDRSRAPSVGHATTSSSSASRDAVAAHLALQMGGCG